jgi:hypothetical protein
LSSVFSFEESPLRGDGSRLDHYHTLDDRTWLEARMPWLFPWFHSRKARRRRNRLFMAANFLAKTSSRSFKNAWGQKDHIEQLAKDYDQSVRGRSLVFHKKGTNEIWQKDYMTRFHSEYYPMHRRRIRDSIARQKIDTALFLTLTLDPKNFDSLAAAKEGVTHGWHKLQAAMLQALKRGTMAREAWGETAAIEGWDGRYYLAVEFQSQEGNWTPHLHIVLVGCTFVSQAWVHSLWTEKWRVGAIVNMERAYGNRSKAAWYATKYMTKGESSFTHRSLLWSLNARAFTHSQGILDDSMTNFNSFGGQWEYIASFDWSVSRPWTTWLEVLGEIEPTGG